MTYLLFHVYESVSAHIPDAASFSNVICFGNNPKD